MPTVYGIKNCNTMKKAFAWLDEHGVAYTFHDYKKAGIDQARLRGWLDALGWEALINRRGTTWRRLPEDVRENMDADGALAVMRDNQSIIRRPLIELDDGGYLLGFDADEYAERF